MPCSRMLNMQSSWFDPSASFDNLNSSHKPNIYLLVSVNKIHDASFSIFYILKLWLKWRIWIIPPALINTHTCSVMVNMRLKLSKLEIEMFKCRDDDRSSRAAWRHSCQDLLCKTSSAQSAFCEGGAESWSSPPHLVSHKPANGFKLWAPFSPAVLSFHCFFMAALRYSHQTTASVWVQTVNKCERLSRDCAAAVRCALQDVHRHVSLVIFRCLYGKSPDQRSVCGVTELRSASAVSGSSYKNKAAFLTSW